MSNYFSERPRNIEVKHFNDHITIIINRTIYFTITDKLIIFAFSCLIYSLLFIPFFIFYFYTLSGLFLFLSLIYITFYKLSNDIYKTYIFAYDDGITIQNKLIDFLKQNKIFLKNKETKNLYLKKQDNRKYNFLRLKEVKFWYYEIFANQKNGSNKKILDVQTQEEALFIEKILKDYLTIKDNPQEREVD